MARQQKLKLDIEAQISNLKELQAQLQEIQGGGAKKEKLNKDLSNIINQMGGFSKLGNIPDMKKFTKMFDSIIKQLPDTIKELSSGMKDLINPNLLKAVDDANKAVEKAEAEFKSKVKNLEQTYGSRYDSEGKIQTKITTSLKSFYQTDAGKGMLDAKGNQISWQQLKGIGKGQAGKNSEKYLADLKKTLGFKTADDLTKFLDSVKSFWEYHNSQAKKFETEYKSAESALSTTVESKNTAEKNVEDALAKQTEENSKNLNEALADLTKSAADLNKRFNEIVDQRSGNERPGSRGSQDETSQQETEERKKDVDALKKQNKELEKQDSTVKKAIKSFFGYRAILGALRKTVSTAVQSIKQIDEALTQQAMVTGQTREQTYKLLTSYQDLAKQVGATTTEVASVATEYMRQGRSATEALKLTEAAVSAAKVASISTSDSVDYLTTAINGFQLAADDAMAVSDRFAALASSSATSYEELAIGLSKVASQANLAGMSMDFTLGLIAKGIETTRESAESIGTALKTIVARMREMTDYGETLEDGTDINNVEKQLAYVGIALRDAQGNLRSTEDVLNEVGKAWDSFSSNQQAAIAKALAGSRQQSRLIAMMSDYDRTMELTQISMESEGATAAQLEQYMSSLTAATNRLTTSWQGLVQSFVNSDAVIWVVDALATFVGWLSEGYNWLWAVIPVTLVLITVLKKTVAAYILKAAAAIAAGIAAKKAGDAAEEAGNKAAAAWIKALGPIGIAAAALIGIAALVVCAIANIDSQAEKSAKKIAELQNEIYNIKKASTAIDSAISKFDNLDSKVIKTKEDIDAMNEALTSVRDTLSDEIIEKYYAEGSVEQFRMLEGVELKAALERIQEELQNAEIKRRQKQVRELRKNGRSLSDAYNNMVAQGYGASANAGVASAAALELMDYSMEDRAIVNSKLNLLNYKDIAELVDSDQMKQFAKDTLAINKAMEEVLSKGTMSEQAAAFEKLKNTYGANNKALETLVKEYPQLKAFLAMQKSRVLASVEAYGMGINEVNDFTKAIQDLNKKYNKNIEWHLAVERLANGESFESIARSFNLAGDAAKDFYNALDKASSDSALSISQDADKLMNSISSVWEMQEKVLSGQASESEITEFLNNHLELTQDKDFADAFFGGEDLTPFLETLYNDDRDKLKASIDKQIASAMARGDAARVKQLKKIQGKIEKLIQNDPTIDEIVAQQNALEEKFTEISDKRIEELEKEKDKELELLDEKRKAYEDYYDSLEEMSEIEDYEEERQKIVNQLNKLSASSDATSMNKALELEKKLAELDKDHQKTLREQAKKAMLESFDTQEEELESKYEKLIEAVPESVKQGIETNQQAFEQYAKFLATTGITQEKFLVEMRGFAESLGITNFGKILQDLKDIQSDFKTSITNNNTANVTVNTSTNGDSFSNSLVKLLQQYGLIVT